MIIIFSCLFKFICTILLAVCVSDGIQLRTDLENKIIKGEHFESDCEVVVFNHTVFIHEIKRRELTQLSIDERAVNLTVNEIAIDDIQLLGNCMVIMSIHGVSNERKLVRHDYRAQSFEVYSTLGLAKKAWLFEHPLKLFPARVHSTMLLILLSTVTSRNSICHYLISMKHTKSFMSYSISNCQLVRDVLLVKSKTSGFKFLFLVLLEAPESACLVEQVVQVNDNGTLSLSKMKRSETFIYRDAISFRTLILEKVILYDSKSVRFYNHTNMKMHNVSLDVDDNETLRQLAVSVSGQFVFVTDQQSVFYMNERQKMSKIFKSNTLTDDYSGHVVALRKGEGDIELTKVIQKPSGGHELVAKPMNLFQRQIVVETCVNEELSSVVNALDLQLIITESTKQRRANQSLTLVAYRNVSKINFLATVKIPVWSQVDFKVDTKNYLIYHRVWYSPSVYKDTYLSKLNSTTGRKAHSLKFLSNHLVNTFRENLNCLSLNSYTAKRISELEIKGLNSRYLPMSSILEFQTQATPELKHKIPILYVKSGHPLKLRFFENNTSINLTADDFYILEFHHTHPENILKIHQPSENCVKISPIKKSSLHSLFHYAALKRQLSNNTISLSTVLRSYFQLNSSSNTRFCEAVYEDTKPLLAKNTSNKEYLFSVYLFATSSIERQTFRLYVYGEEIFYPYPAFLTTGLAFLLGALTLISAFLMKTTLEKLIENQRDYIEWLNKLDANGEAIKMKSS